MPLSFRRSTASPVALSDGITQVYVNTSTGPLELLAAVPESASQATPLFFVHGGFGCAAVWLEYISLLSAAPHNIPCYAISLRGHGASWKPGYFRMTWGTSKRALADDITAGVRYVESQLKNNGVRDSRVVLVAHSNGGGLSQLALHDGDFEVKALALLDATPPFGLLGVYWNWLKADPWFPLRVYPHLMHSRSPLSSTRLVKNAFFCDEYPLDRVPCFENLMAPFESLLWPMAMMTRFVSIQRILQRITLSVSRPAILIMAAERSRLMGVPMMRQMADEYVRGAALVLRTRDDNPSAGDLAQVVRFEVVNGAGHHLQNDLNWRDGAVKLAAFYRDATASTSSVYVSGKE